jgi:type I restriction enzyme M protein
MQHKLIQNSNSDKQVPLLVFDHKEAYHQIRNYLAGRLVGATRDEALLDEVIKCLFCKIQIKRQNIRLGNLKDSVALAKLYRQIFSELRQLLPAIFDQDDELLLDPASLAYVDQMLEFVDIDDLARDPFGDAYEVFIGSSIRGQEGQFFTPQNAIRLLVSIVDPRPGERIIDPACGSGGFLGTTAQHLIALGASLKDTATNILGVDKDRYLVSLAASRLSLITLAPARVFCADSLAWDTEEDQGFPLKHQMGKFDIVLTNPPFGSRIVAASRDVQRSFDLGYRWKFSSRAGRFAKLAELRSSVPPQVLFVERCISLVQPGGRIGMVVPESLISSKSYRYVVQYIRERSHIRAVIGMPESLFKTSGKGGTHTKTCLLVLEKKDNEASSIIENAIFMAEAQRCGHDSRGRQIGPDDLPEIAAKYREFRDGIVMSKRSHLGYYVSVDQLVDDVLAPRYYNPDVAKQLSLLRETHDLVKVGDLVSSGIIEITTGDEIGKLAYGTGSIPFVRTSDISNWEIKVDPKHCVSEDIYHTLARKQDVRESDILMVRDGTYLIGTCAFITKYDTRVLFQSHLYKLRVTDHSKLSPYLLLAALSSDPVRRQIKAKRFTQDIIDSLGNRIHEIVLPIPKDKSLRDRVTKMVEQAIQERIEARELARKACLELVRTARIGPKSDEDELVQN